MKKIFITALMLFISTPVFATVQKPATKPQFKPTFIQIQTKKGYKSIEPLNKTKARYTNYSYFILEKFISMDTDLQEYLQSNHSLQEKLSIYETYIDNLLFYIEHLNLSVHIYDDFENDQNITTIEGVEFIKDINSHNIKFSDNNKCNSLIMISAGEGFYTPVINAEYQYKNAAYLNSQWQEYWRIKVQEQKDLAGSDFYSDGSVVPKMNILANWIILWNKFLITYPHFYLRYEITDTLDFYISHLMTASLYDFDYWREDRLTLTQKGCEVFEYLKQELLPNMYSFRIFYNAYRYLKESDYMATPAYFELRPVKVQIFLYQSNKE